MLRTGFVTLPGVLGISLRNHCFPASPCDLAVGSNSISSVSARESSLQGIDTVPFFITSVLFNS